LYLPDRDVDMLRRAIDVPALSPGWQQSFAELLAAHENRSGATPPPIGTEPGWTGFRTLRVAETRRESPTVLSIELEATDRGTLPVARPGQFLTLRLPSSDPALLRSYSLSSTEPRYRISVKREDHGLASTWIHDNVRAGIVMEAAAPRGDFYLGDEAVPVVLVSAGIGVTPVLAMLHALSAQHSKREIWWLHITRDAQTLAFGGEVGELIESLTHARQHVFYTAEAGRPDAAAIAALGLPREAIAYLCGPELFMTEMRNALAAAGIDAARIHSELFGALPPINPGITDAPHRSPHLPDGAPGTGPPVSFARSGMTVNWSASYDSILELAEACDVPTRFSCRSGVCHICVTPLVDGAITYTQQPLELPADGTVLICSAQPSSGVVLDL
jgi:ferredoxin-NADP reductase